MYLTFCFIEVLQKRYLLNALFPLYLIFIRLKLDNLTAYASIDLILFLSNTIRNQRGM